MENNPYKPGYEKKKEPLIDPKTAKKDMDGVTAALNILVCFLLCGVIGYFIDKHYGTHVWIIRGAIFGLVVGMIHFIKFIIDSMKG